MKSKKKGLKFDAKYGVETCTIYKGDTDALKIPPMGHPLYDATAPTTFDPLRVAAIDRDNEMGDPLEVWAEPDKNILWMIDGRGRLLDVREVNRRRLARGCTELVKPLIRPFYGDEKAVIARVREKNYHRRVPSASDMAVDLRVLRRAGHSWESCAAALHHETADAEQWGRKLVPLAHCIAEVREAIDQGKLPRTAARLFGGSKEDGSEALGREGQLALLREKLAERESADRALLPKAVSPKARERARAALQNGATKEFHPNECAAARVVAATIARINGDERALDAWPAVAALFNDSVAKKAEAKRGQ